MVKLLNENDRFVVNSASFVKNAVFYKDLFAFYDAYENLMNSNAGSLPTYCCHRGKFYLEGICLLFCNYSSELGFASIKLNLNYLKVLYYTLASLSEDGNFPDRELLEREYSTYHQASKIQMEKSVEQTQNLQGKYSLNKDKIKQLKSKKIRQLGLEKFFLILLVSVITLGLFACALPFGYYWAARTTLSSAIIFCAVIFVVCLVLAIVFFFAKKHSGNLAQGTDYEIQVEGQKFREIKEEYFNSLYARNSITCENYEYSTDRVNLSPSALTFEEILAKASEYNLLSYNIAHDCEEILENEESEKNGLLSKISKLAKHDFAELKNIYKQICGKDWLYYSGEIRYAFVSKVAELAPRTHDYLAGIDGEGTFPFNINIKEVAKEQVLFQKDNTSPLVCAPYDLLERSKIAKKSLSEMVAELSGVQKLKAKKYWFVTHYYRLAENEENLEDVKNEEMLNKNAPPKVRHLPMLEETKLKLQELELGATNADSSVVGSITETILQVTQPEVFEEMVPQEQNLGSDQDVVMEKIEEVGEGEVKFIGSEGSFVGWKI